MAEPKSISPSERECEALDAFYNSRPLEGPEFEARVAARIELNALDEAEANLGSDADS